MNLEGVDPAVYQRLGSANLAETLLLLATLNDALPDEFKTLMIERMAIYRGFVESPRFVALPADDAQVLTLKGWILRDWADQARQIKERIETRLTAL